MQPTKKLQQGKKSYTTATKKGGPLVATLFGIGLVPYYFNKTLLVYTSLPEIALTKHIIDLLNASFSLKCSSMVNI
jgi:hypothetical protein